MGMYDSVMVDCPNCGHRNENQSKSGKCELKEYETTNVPIEVAWGLEIEIQCERCEKIIGFAGIVSKRIEIRPYIKN